MNKISEIPEQESIPENPAVETSADPWRCEECGSLEVSYRTWVDSNTGQVAPGFPEQDDLWCDGCEEHTYQIRESELMSDTVEPWWNDGTTEEDREIITGLNPENFSPKDDRKGFPRRLRHVVERQDERREDPSLAASYRSGGRIT